MRYIGGKNAEGVAQRIINLIPPHRVYIEPFLGSGAVLRTKAPAEKSIGCDLVPTLFPALRSAAPNLALLQECGVRFLECYRWTGDELVYADPPYLLSTRGGRRYYRAEMSDADHLRLLGVLKRIPAKVILSGYPSDLYARELEDWSVETFRAWTRNHRPRTECLWFNFPRPTVLHDTRFVGRDRRERWNVERRRRRLRERFLRMAPLSRAALFSALVDVMKSLGEATPGASR
ncbi:MAG TPA: DNA adenine methylase [Opitutaceae bacterium]|nr:DNA adenine methylase [Opitutaceae bacterium]